jgi:hypothetical protein
MFTRLLFVSCCVAATIVRRPAHADTERDSGEAQTLLDGDSKIGGYGGVEVRTSSVLDTTAALVGGQGGVVLDHRLILGGAGYGLASRVDVPEPLRTPGASRRLSLGYGGARVAWVVAPRSIVHVVTGALIGGGAVAWEANTGAIEYDDGVAEPDMSTRSDTFFVVEPQLEFEVNLHRLVRFGLSASYRFTQGVDNRSIDDSDISGLALGGLFKFGVF